MMPARQGVLSLPLPTRLLLAAQPKPLTIMLQLEYRVISRFLPGQVDLKSRRTLRGVDPGSIGVRSD